MASNIVDKTREKYLEYEHRHQEILDAAIELFNNKGFQSTTVVEIAKKAGITEPTMYKHFENKQALFIACFNLISEELLARYKKVYKETENDETRYLKKVTREFIDYIIQNPNKSMFLVHLLASESPEFITVYKDFVRKSINSFAAVIETAQTKGKITKKYDKVLISTFLIAQSYAVIAMKKISDHKLINKKNPLLDETFADIFANFFELM